MITSLKQLSHQIAMLERPYPDEGLTAAQIRQNTHFAFTAFANDFHEYRNKYCKKGRNYSDKEIADQIFNELDPQNTVKYKNQLRIRLHCANEYVQHLIKNVTTANVDKYKKVLRALVIDVETLVVQTEREFAQNSKTGLWSGRRPWQHPREIYRAAWDLFDIEAHDRIKDLDMRNIRPATIFLIRQCIEVYGKNILGLEKIVDNKGSVSKKHTHIAWEFILIESQKKSTNIELPFDPVIIDKVYRWSNSYIHTTYYPDCYIVHAVLSLTNPLFKIADQYIKIYTGMLSRDTTYAAIKIHNYEQVKQRFNQYINRNGDIFNWWDKLLIKLKMKEVPQNNYTPNWMELNKVGAYIISL